VVAAIGWGVVVVGEDVFEVFAGVVHAFCLEAQGVDTFLDDLGPASGGGRGGEDVADLFQAHQPGAPPVLDDGQSADLGWPVPAAAGVPGGGLDQPAVFVIAEGRGAQPETASHLVDRDQVGLAGHVSLHAGLLQAGPGLPGQPLAFKQT